jgi:phage terminase small subunit
MQFDDVLTTAERAFCAAYSACGDATQAYLLAYPRCNANSARAAASRLLDRLRVAKAVASFDVVAKVARQYLEVPEADKSEALKRLVSAAKAELAARERLSETAPAA